MFLHKLISTRFLFPHILWRAGTFGGRLAPCQEGPDHAAPRSFDCQVPSRCPTRRPLLLAPTRNHAHRRMHSPAQGTTPTVHAFFQVIALCKLFYVSCFAGGSTRPRPWFTLRWTIFHNFSCRLAHSQEDTASSYRIQ